MMGIDVLECDGGRAAIGMSVTPPMQNGEGFLQGGLFTALADEAMVLAIYQVLEEGSTLATISETTNYMRGISGGLVRAEGSIVKKGRRVVFAEAAVFDCTGSEKRLLSATQAAYAVRSPS
jgi:acyl-CoA thioesterase